MANQDNRGTANQCPFNPSNHQVSRAARFYARINYWGMKYLKGLWLPQYGGPLYPGVLAHHYGHPIHGHQKNFTQRTTVEGESATDYFKETGMQALARANAGLCTFRMGNQLAIYQNKNIPLVKDEYLAPSTNENKFLFGEFMGTMPHGDKVRNLKRSAVKASLSNIQFVQNAEQIILTRIEKSIRRYAGIKMSVEDFARLVVSDVDSYVPGVLDLTQKPLTDYIEDERFREVAIEFIEIASKVIGKLDRASAEAFETVGCFIRTVLLDNYDAILSGPDTNIIKRHFKIWSVPFTIDAIKSLPDENLKELGTIMVAIYDTTSLSLSWALPAIERDCAIKENVKRDAHNAISHDQISYIDKVVFEALRLGGSNPTALWRRVDKAFSLTVDGAQIYVPKGTMLWLDRRDANCDPEVFPHPNEFNPENITALTAHCKPSLSAVMTMNKYEINSFSMVNTEKNPRKCPGRLFSVFIQSLVIRTLYRLCDVRIDDISFSLKKHSAMPRMDNAGQIIFTIKQEEVVDAA